MTEHPYYAVLTVAVALVTISILVFVAIGCAWAWTKLAAARDMRRWAAITRIDWDAESEQLCAEERP